MKSCVNIAVVGATGVVGETMIRVLEERHFPVGTLYPLASQRSVGKTVTFQGCEYEILDLTTFDFSKTHIALFSAGSDVSKIYAPLAAQAGCIVIDNTAYFRQEEDIPLVIPEVNPLRIGDYTHRNMIANPNCSTIQMLVALKPIYDVIKIRRIHVCTYQSVSGTGREAIHELIHQVGELINGRPIEPHVYPQQIAFNVLPHIDVFLDNGYTKEEMKMIWETQKILEDPDIAVNPTTVRVPVLYGHSESIHIEADDLLTPHMVKSLLEHAPGVVVIDDPKTQTYPTPITHAIGKDEVFVGRIRQDLFNPYAIHLWVVADNLRKGAATNSIQIAEKLYTDYL